jgi:ergothioneine biosynthesis protein EgtB
MTISRALKPAPVEVQSVTLESSYRAVREASERLCRPLSPEDATVQSMPNASPAKWHLAHTSWFFETFVLERAIADYRHFNPAYRVMFNSYYQAVGEQYSRPQRGLLTRPSLDEVYAYRRHVDEQVRKLLSGTRALTAEQARVIELGLHHEQQHQELLLTDIKHLFWFNPLHPVYREAPASSAPQTIAPLQWHSYPGGICSVGHGGASFAFDNEGPRHRALLEPFELASRLVTNREYLAFIRSGGYQLPEFWLSDGWDAVRNQAWRAPLYWLERDGAWFAHTLGGLRELNLDEPVCHVNYYEADAYARFAQARLPSEIEWETAASSAAIEGNFVESDLLHPTPLQNNAGAAAPQQLFGDVWEWTGSAYLPYPGFRAGTGALGEYNGKFMSNQMVLRGGSCATPQSHIRATYRNFFQPDSRWQFTGIRLAREAR